MELVLPLAMVNEAAHDDALEADLVAASLRGDHEAFTRLVRRHQARVFRIAGRFFRDRADVEDVAQETFLAAWRRLATYEARAPFEHWITRIALRCSYARLRGTRRNESPLPAIEPAAASHDPDVPLEVERLLAHLSPADRFVLLLLDGEGWSVKEIADQIGWSVTNVKVRAFRARHRLRCLLLERP